MTIPPRLFSISVPAIVLAMLTTAPGPGLAAPLPAPEVRIVSPAPRTPVTGYTCVAAKTSIERIDEVLLMVDGMELARMDDPEKTNQLIGGATLCLDTAQISNGDHRLDFAFFGDGGRAGMASSRLATDNPAFRVLGVSPSKPVYRGGETVELLVEASHAGLSVAADFSKMDNGYRAGSETVVPLGDGKYRVAYALSRANSRGVGLYPITIQVSQSGRSRLYVGGLSLGFLPRRDTPLAPKAEARATQIFGPLPAAAGTTLRILSVESSASAPVKIGESVRVSGLVASASGPRATSSASEGRAVTLFLGESASDGFYRAPVPLSPCSEGPPGCLGRFDIDLEMTAGGAAPLTGPTTLNLQLVLEDARGGISGPASLPIPVDPVIGVPLPPPMPFRISGRFEYNAPNPVFLQNGPNDISMLSEFTVIHPIRFATVSVIREDDGAVLGTSLTDHHGNYSIDFTNPPGGFVHASAYTLLDIPAAKARVFNSSLEGYKLSTSSWVAQFEPDKFLVTASAGSQWLIFDNMLRGLDFVADFAGKTMPRINVMWEHGYAQGLPNSGYVGGHNCTRTSYYSRSEMPGGMLHLTSKPHNILPKVSDVEDEDTGMHECVPIPGEFLSGDQDDDDTPVQTHEFGHFLQHYLTRAESCTHGAQPPKSAWCEGAPTGIGQTILGTPFYYDRVFNGNDVEVLIVQNVDQNTGGSNNQAEMPVCGPYSDGWVWRLLYDFFDPSSSSLDQITWNWGPATNVAPEPVTVTDEGVNFGLNFDRVHNIKATMDVLAQYLSVDDASPADRGPEGPEFVDFLDGWFLMGNGQALDVVTLTWNVMAFGYDFGFLGDNLCNQSLVDTIDSFAASGDIGNPGVANSLRQKAAKAQSALDQGRLNEASNLLAAFQHEIDAQRGKKISDRAAAVLKSLAAGMMEQTRTRP